MLLAVAGPARLDERVRVRLGVVPDEECEEEAEGAGAT